MHQDFLINTWLNEMVIKAHMGSTSMFKKIISSAPGVSPDGGSFWLNCFTEDNQKIILWGSLENRANILLIQQARLPCLIEFEADTCTPSSYIKRKYRADWSVGEGAVLALHESAD